MTKCVNVIAYIAIATRASIGCVALCSTSRSCYNCFVVVNMRRYIIGIGCSASTTAELGIIAEIVTECINISVFIAVAARASMSCVTLLCTSRSCYNCFVVVNMRRYIIGIGCSASTTAELGIIAEIVTECINISVFIAVAARASMSCVTLLCTSRSCYNCFVVVNMRRYIIGIGCSASTTAELGIIAEIVTECINISVFIAVATRASMKCISLLCASGCFHNIGIRMNMSRVIIYQISDKG